MSTTDPRRWLAERLREQDILAIGAALTHVLDLHKPFTGNIPGDPICDHCEAMDDYGYGTGVEWPCATVRTIMDTPRN